MASAVFSGSCGSSGGGALDVLTEQNLQPRVHVSPINCGRHQHSAKVGKMCSESYHDCCGSGTATVFFGYGALPTPTVIDVWTTSFFAYCMKTKSPEVFFHLIE